MNFILNCRQKVCYRFQAKDRMKLRFSTEEQLPVIFYFQEQGTFTASHLIKQDAAKFLILQ